jgi:hypothetical protein
MIWVFATSEKQFRQHLRLGSFDFAQALLWHAGCSLPGMRASNSFRDLQVWQEAMLLVEDVYRLTKQFPPDGDVLNFL